MQAVDVLREIQTRRLRCEPEGDGIRITGPAASLDNELRAAIRECKPALLALLARPMPAATPEPSAADAWGVELARLEALGADLKSGRIRAIRCGITQRRCTACAGVPCVGSEPWEDDV